MRLSDITYMLFHINGDWQEMARCRDLDIEMVPGKEGQHRNAGTDVQEAKRTCRGCPALEQCLIAGSNGREAGVWGGLTFVERERIRVATNDGRPRPIVPCEVCGLDCVPPLSHIHKCDTCIPDEERPRFVEEYKHEILGMIHDRKSYAVIAETLGFRADVVGKACRKWGKRSTAVRQPGTNSKDTILLAPCGTPAAKRRHLRRNEPTDRCACGQPGSSNPARTKKNGWIG